VGRGSEAKGVTAFLPGPCWPCRPARSAIGTDSCHCKPFDDAAKGRSDPPCQARSPQSPWWWLELGPDGARCQSGDRSRDCQLVGAIEPPPAKEGAGVGLNWAWVELGGGDQRRPGRGLSVRPAQARSPAAGLGQCWWIHPSQRWFLRAPPAAAIRLRGATRDRHPPASARKQLADRGPVFARERRIGAAIIPNFSVGHGCCSSRPPPPAARFYDLRRTHELHPQPQGRRPQAAPCLKPPN